MKEIDLEEDFEGAVCEAFSVLREGGLVIYPTDTIYGVGCDAFDKNAVKEIFNIKKRNWDKNVSVMVKDWEMLSEIVEVDKRSKEIFEKLLPGQITLVFNKKSKKVFVGSGKGIGIRISHDKFTKELMKNVNFPIVTTSVNVSGDNPWKGRGDLPGNFKKVDLIVKKGVLKGPSSTLLDLRGEKVELLKEGRVSWEKIKKIIKDGI